MPAERRPLPRLLLLPLPAVDDEKKHGRTPPVLSGRRPGGCPLSELLANDGFMEALMYSLDDLRALVRFVLQLLADRPSYAKEMILWLEGIGGCLDGFEDEAERGAFAGLVTLETEGVSELEEVLSHPRHYEGWEDAEDATLEKLVNFWGDEVGRRGRELLDLVGGAVVAFEARDVLQVTRKVRYPLG